MFDTNSVASDLWAGLTVALVALPLNLALAIAAGVDPSIGITTGVVAAIVVAFFGGQRFAITGPAAAMAVVLVEIVRDYGISAVWLVGLIAGVMQIAAGAFRLGRFISFIPMPVIVGFANAIGILVAFNAFDDFFGVGKHLKHAHESAPLINHPSLPAFLRDIYSLFWCLFRFAETNLITVAIGSFALGIAVLLPRLTKAIPGQLVAIVAATVVTSLINLPIPRIGDISSIPNTFPLPQIPALPLDQLPVLFASAVTVFMLGSIESLLSRRSPYETCVCNPLLCLSHSHVFFREICRTNSAHCIVSNLDSNRCPLDRMGADATNLESLKSGGNGIADYHRCVINN